MKSRTCYTCSLLVTWLYVCGSVPENYIHEPINSLLLLKKQNQLYNYFNV